MKPTYLAAALAAAVTMTGPAHAAFFGQAGNGDIYRIDEISGAATKVSGVGSIGSGSTNALGFDGSDFFRTQGADGQDLYKNDDEFVKDVGKSFGATVVGDTYYAVDESNNKLFSVDLSSSSPEKTFVPNGKLSSTKALGDIVFDGTNLLVSQQDVGIVKVATDGEVLATFTNSDSTGSNARFPGLAFVGSDLYGLTDTDNLNAFAKVSLDSIDEEFTIGDVIDIDGLPDGVGMYDFATVPLPAAAWLMIGGLGAVGAYARRARKAAPTA